MNVVENPGSKLISAVPARELAHLSPFLERPFPRPCLSSGQSRVMALAVLPLPAGQRAHQKCELYREGKLGHGAKSFVQGHQEAKVVLEVELLFPELWVCALPSAPSCSGACFPHQCWAGGRDGSGAHPEHGSSRPREALAAGPGCLLYPREKPGFVHHHLHL